MDIKEENINILREIANLDDTIDKGNCNIPQITLVLLDIKPGSYSRVPVQKSDKFETFLNSLSLHYNSFEQSAYNKYIYTKDKEKLSNFEKDDYSEGKIYGYPEDDIKYYINNENRVIQYKNYLEENDIKMPLYLVEYLPRPKKYNLYRALKKEYARRCILKEIDFIKNRYPIQDNEEIEKSLINLYNI